MGSTLFGNFNRFCNRGTLPVCNLLVKGDESPWKAYGRYELLGIGLDGGRHLRNLGSMILAFIAILMTLFLLRRSERKQAAVGRREMQLFLAGYIVVEICEIFTVGGIPLPTRVLKGFSAVHIAAITVTCWILFLNGIVGYQLLDDGTASSIALFVGSSLIIFIGTGYIALDTGFNWTHFWESSSYDPDRNRNIALYVLYQIFPLACIVFYYILQVALVIFVLGEFRPILCITFALFSFATGQVFTYVISPYIREGTHGKIDGTLFETFFTLLTVAMIYIFWSSITEDDWPIPVGVGGLEDNAANHTNHTNNVTNNNRNEP